MDALTYFICVLFLINYFRELIVTCWSCVIYVKEELHGHQCTLSEKGY